MAEVSYFAGTWDNGVLNLPVQHFLSEVEYPKGTRVRFRPYPADEGYAEVMIPDGSLITMSWNDIEVEE